MSSSFLEGIDVSSHQGKVDWDAVCAEGKVFAFARATIGGHQIDSQFSANWQGIADAGLMQAAYHFFWPLTSWQDQAENFIKTVATLEVSDLPPIIDLEEAISNTDQSKKDNWTAVPLDRRLSMIQNWLDRIEQTMGIQPMIYTRHLADGIQAFGKYGLWIAHYDVAQPSTPTGWDSWTFWQYSDIGTVAAILGKVDCDRVEGSLDDLQKLAKS